MTFVAYWIIWGLSVTVRGDHFIYRRDDTPIINIHPNGNKAKAYQVKQVRSIILLYKPEVQ